MQISLGQKIRELRRRDGRTQEALAEALGVTSQAVSRWEANGGYPDMEILPAIANYFHVSIDELFGYSSDREQRINEVITKAEKMLAKKGLMFSVGSIPSVVTECVEMLKAACEEFPNEPKLFLYLAQALNAMGWYKYGSRSRVCGDNGILEHDAEYNSQNECWKESIAAYERCLAAEPSPADFKKAVIQLTPLYSRMGERKKAKALAESQHPLCLSKEILLTMATDGEERALYNGEAILELLSELKFIVFCSLSRTEYNDYEKRMLLSVINLYETLFSDGRCGVCHWDLGHLYLTLARREAKSGNGFAQAMNYFEKGFVHCEKYKTLKDETEYSYSAPLISRNKCVIKEKYLPMEEDFWEKELKTFPESFKNELCKNEKYANCFENND